MTDFLGLAWPDGRVCVLCLAEKEHTEHVPVAERAHPDAGDATRNHYDWFFPNGAPDGLPESWLADIEAKMVEGLSDPFVDDAARIMLVLIAEVRRLRAAPPTGCTTPDPDPASPCGFEESDIFGACGMPDASWQHFRCLVGPSDPEGPCPDPCPATSGCHPHIPTRCRCGHAITRTEA